MDRTDYDIGSNVAETTDKYVHVDPQKRPNQEKTKDITKAMRKHFADRYKKIDAVKNAKDPKDRTTKLYKSEGTKLSKQNTYVVEFSVAGSSFETFRLEHKGIHGKEMKMYGPIEDASGTRKKIDPKSNEYQRRMEHTYGAKAAPKGPDFVFKKETRNTNGLVTKSKFSIGGAGVDTAFGVSNTGEYSIENTRNRILVMGIEQLKPLLDAWEKHEDTPQKNIELMFRGHSRGAVATAQGAMMLNDWIRKNYSEEVANRVHFNVLMLDPVPGAGSNKGANEYIDFKNPTADMKKDLGIDFPFKDSDDTTVIMSGSLEKDGVAQKLGTFTPQHVSGAKRVLITQTKHSVNLKEFDATQADGYHQSEYTDENGDVYRSYGLGKLPEGVYFVDQDRNMIQARTPEEVDKVFDEAFSVKASLGSAMQGSRREILKGMAEMGAMRHMMKDSSTPKVFQSFINLLEHTNPALATEENSLTEIDDFQKQFRKTDGIFVKMTPQYKAMMDALTNLHKVTHPLDYARYGAALTKMSEAVQNYTEYKKDNINGSRARHRFDIANNLKLYVAKCQKELEMVRTGQWNPQKEAGNRAEIQKNLMELRFAQEHNMQVDPHVISELNKVQDRQMLQQMSNSETFKQDYQQFKQEKEDFLAQQQLQGPQNPEAL